MNTDEIRAEVERSIGRGPDRAGAEAVAEAARTAADSPAVVEVRGRRDHMTVRVEQYRADRARLEAEADQLAAKVRASIVAGDDAQADALETKLAKVRLEADKLARRLPELESALKELESELASTEAKAARLACRSLVPGAVSALTAVRSELEQLEASFKQSFAALVERERFAERLLRHLQDGASPNSYYRNATPWTCQDQFADEAAEAGLPVLPVVR